MDVGVGLSVGFQRDEQRAASSGEPKASGQEVGAMRGEERGAG